MRSADVVIIGGSAAGLTAALTARRHYPDKKILLIRREEQVLIPCGIPYIIGTVGSPEKNLMPDAPLEKNRIDLLIAEATDLDREKKIVTAGGEEITYEKLIVATGSLPAVPPIPGFELPGVYAVQKDVAYIRDFQQRLTEVSEVVIIGGGFIGIEFADEIFKTGNKTVTIIEILPHCLSLAYDDEFCVEAEAVLKERGINVHIDTKVEAIIGSDRVEGVRLSNGDTISADMVVLGIGAVANVELAQKAGLRLGMTGSIAVDRTMRTSDADIFACGDCAEKLSFFGGRVSPLKLASIASTEAHVAGANLFGINRDNPGTVGVWSTAVGAFALGTAGLTEKMALENGYEVAVGTVEGPNRHPGIMPGNSSTKMKLVFEAKTGILLGGQVRGGDNVGDLINSVSACVQQRMTADQLAMFQTGTHPALTASPVAYPLVNAAEIAIGVMRSRS